MLEVAEFVQSRCDLPKSEVDWLVNAGKQRLLARGKVFCGIGQTQHELAFVEDGVMQVYAVSSDGVPVVLDFASKGMLVGALESAVTGEPSQVCFEAITPTVLTVWPYDLRFKASERSRGWERLAIRVMEEAFLRKHKRYLSLRTRSADERYADLTKELSFDWHVIPQHILASYLNITPQYLSRIKLRATTRAQPR